ncbi:Salicylate biosynthesis isochorismate synthase [Jeotgalicoccus aerolatus]|uniref:isochorismate synthase n=2 Tax=Jeotgalicoccus aerolatus TaxID=709510 RepID=A0ABS4HNW8_9STAP|nr:isochorismate synthase [Jeotgalicoccus aerolatus]MBP1952625.1 menaquinone-specific isochorismate synthase [Jeotgalicoccus aerolatus]NMA80766.1 isochorismate synthase [Jeotgalicoccus aerolatus]GGD92110.1 menaquinone-specific isochorismate synthase [Jeotgalicoccus aerolatus]CAD2074191.1 Salicylate biosynthesis isochorismate synthase [Jeotgalicoccus aerolatus]
MKLQSSRTFMENISLDSDRQYLTLHIPVSEYNIDEEKIFTYFNESKGSRYWFKSKDGTYNVVGINYIESMWRNKFQPELVTASKNALYAKLQQEALGDDLKSKLSLFGGTLFDDKDTTDEWNDFKMVEFQLPEWQFDLKNQEVFLTRSKEGLNTDGLLEEIDQILTEIEETEITEKEKPVVKSKRDIFPKEWKGLVEEAVNNLNDEFKKVVLARQKLITFESKAKRLYLIRRLKDEADTYTIYYEKNKSTFVSKTPEKLFSIDGEVLNTNAVAGSIQRVDDQEQNKVQTDFLLNDEKNLFEHRVVRESIVNDISPFSEGMNYKKNPLLMKNKYIYHLYTPIQAMLKAGADEFNILKEIHPTPAVGGLPKALAKEYIKEHEYGTRGLYAAPLGIIHEDKECEFAVGLRSMLISARSATLFAGCGIVKGSDPEAEFLETEVKFTPMLNVLEATTNELHTSTDGTNV